MTPEEKELFIFFIKEGYYNLKVIPSRGICGLHRFAFTTGLIYGMDITGYVGRYCFPNEEHAKEALENWNGEGDPDGMWIKHKGDIEYTNPKYQPSK